ncbi:hypothetical protein H072_10513 [Dactylellina haptotyla CBS 200.50]|uniref:Uncharacterized protein n=1 Tax=Dactylellina haptotyla (strain CBS 200.50) TaxID=1284197 RepID=S7ZZ25_DACHA|nr:hypothetical protein H072_10513 [Dactylellina haptotyla CBS 200.50]
MCFPSCSVVEEDDRDVVYSNARPISTLHARSGVRNSYLPRSSLRSLRSVKHRLSHSSFSDGTYYDHHIGDYVTRGGVHGYHHHHPPHGAGDKTIVVDNSGNKKSGGTTAVEISDEKAGTKTTVLSANGKKANRALQKKVSWNAVYEKTISDDSSDSSESDSDSDSSSSSDSRESRRSRRGRSLHSRSSSRSRSRSRNSRSRSRSRSHSRSRHDYYNPVYPRDRYDYPISQHQRVVGVPTPVPIPVPGMSYPQNMSPFTQAIPRQIAPATITPLMVQPTPHLLTQEPMHPHHSMQSQYYPGSRAVPMVPQMMHPMGSLYQDADPDLG